MPGQLEISKIFKEHMDLKSCLKVGLFSDEYRILNKIGDGSFSEVIQCEDRHSGIQVAVKILKKTFRSISHAEGIPELIALRKLTHHENILRMIEPHFDRETGKVALVFELMDMSLYDMIRTRKKPILESKAKYFLYQIVKGVEHMHHHGIFHRDIKPENILMKGEVVKIADLGSIKGIYSQQPYTEYVSTRWYRSPECLLTSGYYGPKMDVWSIGCVFFELLTLKPLFPGSSEIDQIAKIHHILGTPSFRLIQKFKKQKPRNLDYDFPAKQGTGLNPLIPFMSEGGRELLKQMLVYDPDGRINIRRLIEHKYFSDLRQGDALYQRSTISLTNITNVKTSWRNPVFLSYLTSDRRRKKRMDGDKKSSDESIKVPVTQAQKTCDWSNEGSSFQKLKERLTSKKWTEPPGESGEQMEEDTNNNNSLKRNRILSSFSKEQILAKKPVEECFKTKIPKLIYGKEVTSMTTFTREGSVQKILHKRLDNEHLQNSNLQDHGRLLAFTKENAVMKILNEGIDKKSAFMKLREARALPAHPGAEYENMGLKKTLLKPKKPGLSNKLLGRYNLFKKQ